MWVESGEEYGLVDISILAIPLEPLLVHFVGHCLVEIANPEVLDRRTGELRASFEVGEGETNGQKASESDYGEQDNRKPNLNQVVDHLGVLRATCDRSSFESLSNFPYLSTKGMSFMFEAQPPATSQIETITGQLNLPGLIQSGILSFATHSVTGGTNCDA
jgi:hypothetical protein